MSLTIDQITAEITAQPELKTQLFGTLKNDFTESLKAEGVTFRTKDEETQFLTNYEANIIPTKVQAEIGAKIKAVHDQYDTDLFELTGEKKAPTEKTYDFMKRTLTALKKKAKSDDDPVLADQVKDLTAKIKQYEGYVAPEEVEKIKTGFFSKQVGMSLANTLAKKAIAVPAHITDEKVKQQFIENQKGLISNAFLSKYTAKHDDKGNIVYYEGDKLMTDPKTAAPLTEEQLINEHFSYYFVPEKKATGGAGSGNGGGDKDVDVNEATLKTKTEVIAYLKKKGMVSGGQDFNKEYSRILKEYGITEPGE